MSAKYTFWAWSVNLTKAPLKLTLLQLADNANDDGVSWYSVPKMADRCGMSERALQGHLKALVDMKLLMVKDRPGTSRIYQLQYQEAQLLAPQILRHTPADSAPHPRRICATTPADSADEPNKEPNKEPVIDPKKKAPAVAVDFSSLCMTSDQIEEVKRIRRNNKGGAITQRVVSVLATEFEAAAKIGWGPEDILSEWEMRGWKGFKAEWLKPKVSEMDGLSAISRKNAQNLSGDW